MCFKCVRRQNSLFSVLKDDHLSSVSLYKELSRCPDSILLLADWTQNADALFKKIINVSFIETKEKLHCLKEKYNSIKKKVHCSRRGSICFPPQARSQASAHVLQSVR